MGSKRSKKLSYGHFDEQLIMTTGKSRSFYREKGSSKIDPETIWTIPTKRYSL